MNFERFSKKNKRKFSRLQHFHNWGRRLWRPALIAMVKVVEQQSSNLALWADGACPWHPDTPRYTQWVIISSDHFHYLFKCLAGPLTKINTLTLQGNKSFKNPKIFEQPVQAIHWCATARCGGTRGGTTTVGRWFIAQLYHYQENRGLNVLAGIYKYY